MTVPAKDGLVVLATTTPAPVARSHVRRVYGSDRYATAVAASRAQHVTANTVLLATGEDFADALSSSGLAGVLHAPILLNPPATLRTDVSAEIRRLGAGHVIIVGGTGAISANVESALVGYGCAVERIGGENRYGTASQLAARTASSTSVSTATVFVTRGDEFADALAVAPLAYGKQVPVLLVRPTSIPAETLQMLRAIRPGHVVIVGGTAAVSSSVESALRELCPFVERVAGPNRYGTAAATAEYAVAHGWASTGVVGMATGTRFPDGLAGGAACGDSGGVLLLTNPSGLSAEASGFLARRAYETDVTVYGGISALQASVETALRNLLDR